MYPVLFSFVHSTAVSTWHVCRPVFDALMGIALFFLSREFLANLASEFFSKLWAEKGYAVLTHSRRRRHVHVHKTYTFSVHGKTRSRQSTIDADEEETQKTVQAIQARPMTKPAVRQASMVRHSPLLAKARVEEVYTPGIGETP